MPLRRRTTFTLHALDRVAARLSLSWEQLATILDGDLNVTVGVDPNTNRWRRLFFSEADNEYFVAVQDAATGDVVTVLPLEYHANLRDLVHERHVLALALLLGREPPDTTRMTGVWAKRRRLSLPKGTVHITRIWRAQSGRIMKRNLGTWRPPTPIGDLEVLACDDEFVKHVQRLAARAGIDGQATLNLALHKDRNSEVAHIAVDLSVAAVSEGASDLPVEHPPRASRTYGRFSSKGIKGKITVKRGQKGPG